MVAVRAMSLGWTQPVSLGWTQPVSLGWCRLNWMPAASEPDPLWPPDPPTPAEVRAGAAALAKLRQEYREYLRPADLLDAQGPGRIPKAANPEVFKAMTALEPDVSRLTVEKMRRKVELRSRPERFWARVFEESQLTFDQLAAYRLRIAWRWSREIARIFGLVRVDEYLSEGLVPYLSVETGQMCDPWTTPPQRYTAPAEGTADARHQAQAFPVVEAMLPSEGSPGLSIFPPPIDDDWHNPLIADDYDPTDPEHDPALHAWLKVFCNTSEYLGFADGTRREPDLGRYGLIGLRDPYWTRLVWPSKLEIVTFEEMVVAEALRAIVSGGVGHAERRLATRHGLTPRESDSVVRLAKRDVVRKGKANVEEDRAIMVLRLEEFIQASRRAQPVGGGGREVLLALKQLAIVQGIARAEPQDDMRDILGAMRSVAADQAKEALPDGPSYKMLEMGDGKDDEDDE